VYDISSASGKRTFSDHMIRAVRRLGDSVEREHYLDRIAEMTDVSAAAIRSKFAQKDAEPAERQRKTVRIDTSEIKPDHTTYQDQLLGLLLLYPLTRRVFETIEFEPTFSTAERQFIFEFMTINPQATIVPDLPADLQSVKDYVNIMLLKAEELYQNLDANERLIEVNNLVHRLQKDVRKQKQTEITSQIKDAEDIGDYPRVQELLGSFNELLKEQ